MSNSLLSCSVTEEAQIVELHDVVVTFPGGETRIGCAFVTDGIIFMQGFTAALRDCVVRESKM